MSFRRIGLGFEFVPDGVPLLLAFSRPNAARDELSFEVGVRRRDGRTIITRRVNLMASPTRGSQKELIEELNGLVRADWVTLMREATESVLASHRAGRPFMVTQGEITRPPPPSWLCQGLLLKDKPNCWLGAASTGKSTLAKAMCAYYASGFRFCDREMERGTPLYLDWEDDHESFNRVVFDVCRNLGVWPLPRMLWRDMHGYRLRDQVETLAAKIDGEGVGLLVLDAVAAAGGSTGEHMSWEAIALELEQCLGALPPVTVLALDHVTGAEHKARGTVPIKARGAERKLEFYRNQWSLVTDDQAEEDGRHVVNWTHTKINLGRKELPFATEIEHRESEISIVWHPLERRRVMPESDDDSKATQLLRSLAGTNGRTARELALQVDGREPSLGRVRSVRVTLERALKRGLVGRDDGPPVRYWVTTAGRQNGWHDEPV